jgi:hypothetical protein
MRQAIKSALFGALVGAVAACAIPTEAFAMSAASPSAVGLSSQVDKVWYRRWGGGYRPYYGRYRWSGYRGYRPYYGRGYYPGAAAAGLLGAGLAAAGSGYYGGYYPYYNYNYYYPGYGYGYYNYPSYDYWGW